MAVLRQLIREECQTIQAFWQQQGQQMQMQQQQAPPPLAQTEHTRIASLEASLKDRDNRIADRDKRIAEMVKRIAELERALKGPNPQPVVPPGKTPVPSASKNSEENKKSYAKATGQQGPGTVPKTAPASKVWSQQVALVQLRPKAAETREFDPSQHTLGSIAVQVDPSTVRKLRGNVTQLKKVFEGALKGTDTVKAISLVGNSVVELWVPANPPEMVECCKGALVAAGLPVLTDFNAMATVNEQLPGDAQAALQRRMTRVLQRVYDPIVREGIRQTIREPCIRDAVRTVRPVWVKPRLVTVQRPFSASTTQREDPADDMSATDEEDAKIAAQMEEQQPDDPMDTGDVRWTKVVRGRKQSQSERKGVIRKQQTAHESQQARPAPALRSA